MRVITTNHVSTVTILDTLCLVVSCTEEYQHTEHCIDSGQAAMPDMFVTPAGDTISGFPDTACVRVLPDGDTVVVFDIR